MQLSTHVTIIDLPTGFINYAIDIFLRVICFNMFEAISILISALENDSLFFVIYRIIFLDRTLEDLRVRLQHKLRRL